VRRPVSDCRILWGYRQLVGGFLPATVGWLTTARRGVISSFGMARARRSPPGPHRLRMQAMGRGGRPRASRRAEASQGRRAFPQHSAILRHGPQAEAQVTRFQRLQGLPGDMEVGGDPATSNSGLPSSPRTYLFRAGDLDRKRRC
jgi:hypothetical protein